MYGVEKEHHTLRGWLTEYVEGQLSPSIGGEKMIKKDDLIEITIPEWLAEKKGSDTRNLEGRVEFITEKAILLETQDKDKMWLPLSQITVTKEESEIEEIEEGVIEIGPDDLDSDVPF